MTLDTLPKKQLQELESLSAQLLLLLKKVKDEYETLYTGLEALNQAAGEIRRARYDSDNGEFSSY